MDYAEYIARKFYPISGIFYPFEILQSRLSHLLIVGFWDDADASAPRRPFPQSILYHADVGHFGIRGSAPIRHDSCNYLLNDFVSGGHVLRSSSRTLNQQTLVKMKSIHSVVYMWKGRIIGLRLYLILEYYQLTLLLIVNDIDTDLGVLDFVGFSRNPRLHRE